MNVIQYLRLTETVRCNVHKCKKFRHRIVILLVLRTLTKTTAKDSMCQFYNTGT